MGRPLTGVGPSGEKPTVSVIIPTYNRATKCLRAVDSVLEQTHPHVEVIVVDDGSQDDTAARLRDRDPRIVYIRQENAGVSAARNRGLREATGAYVAFLDSDDVWMPWKLEAQLAVLDRFDDVVMVWSDMHAVDERGNVVAARYLRTMYTAYREFDFDTGWAETVDLGAVCPACPAEARAAKVYCGDIYAPMFMGNLVHTSTVLLRRSTREAVGFFDESLVKTGEDYDYHFRTCAEGRVALLDTPTIRYQVGGADQLTSPALAYLIARNNLETMRKAWVAHPGKIELPARKVARRWADAYLWLGHSLLAPDPRASRRALLRSLAHRPLRPKAVALLLLTWLPQQVTSWVRGVRRYWPSSRQART
jgi:glycosyltransferase involved in cell wall biosynthesis